MKKVLLVVFSLFSASCLAGGGADWPDPPQKLIPGGSDWPDPPMHGFGGTGDWPDPPANA